METIPKILVVDDEAQTLTLIETVFSDLNYELIFAKDGVEALEKVFSCYPDVILLDIRMPRMNGIEVTKNLKSNNETKIIPIVIFSSLQDVENRVKALEAGADDFLSKPVDITELKTRVSSLIKVKAYNDYMRNYQKQLENEIALKTKQIKEASLETIYRLARAAEYRDEDTGNHIKRMSHYAAAIYQKIGKKESNIEEILYASPIHDVGKIGIPDNILLKESKLTSEEWNLMKQHTTIGGEILKSSPIKLVNLAETIALSHHEKWDGSGYPHGLKGSKIPLAGRVTAIADVFDALTSKRPYRKKPYPVEEAFAIVKKRKGSHFDPDLVGTFLSIKEEILSIKKEYEDAEQSWLFSKAQTG